uniref:Phosphatidylethanolamine-binding protein n=1 Tax=Clastoptera arizonana TaxID=38151 RepID=A0A1B6DYK9_9HEMI
MRLSDVRLLLLVFCCASLVCSLEKNYTRLDACFGKNFEIRTSPKNYVLNQEYCDIQSFMNDWEFRPKVYFKDAIKDEFYTVILVSPRPDYGPGEYYLHWLITNLVVSKDSTLVCILKILIVEST